jgi:hypothetical protein
MGRDTAGGGGFGHGGAGDNPKGSASALPYGGGGGMGDDAPLPPGWGPPGEYSDSILQGKVLHESRHSGGLHQRKQSPRRRYHTIL